jgi:hypothetical protein
MSLDEKFSPVRTAIYQITGGVFQKIAGFFGYPTNPGMPVLPDFGNKVYSRSRFLDNLPRHETFWPPFEHPETWFEMIFGPLPKVEAVSRYIYESKEEGFYNFYIENYKNIYFLPDWLSEFLQIQLNFCLDISLLETIREVLFAGLVLYAQMVGLRITLSWFIYINPYTFPWCYLVAVVDWTEDILQGIVPVIFGVNITGSVFLGLLGSVGDSLNHLVFTMPFLPSEAEETKLLINEEMKDVLVFHYLPVLWYRHQIPNDLRTFWYQERTDILNYMKKAYKDLNIIILPDNIIKQSILKQLNQQKLTTELNSVVNMSNTTVKDYFSTELLSNTHSFPPDNLLTQITIVNQHIHQLLVTEVEKFF